MNDYFQNIILKRYSNKEFARKYSKTSLKGLKDYEKILVDNFLKDKNRILVVGCGCGREAFPLAKKGKKITAIDISKEMISEARKISKKKHARIKWIVGNILKANFNQEKFDAILLFNCVINQIPSHKKRKLALRKIHKLLVKKGIIICVSNNAYYPGKGLCNYIEHFKEATRLLMGNKKEGFSDRVYKTKNGQVYLHLPSRKYLKSLLAEKFRLILVTSNENIKCKKIRNKMLGFFDELIIIVGEKK
ncbi:MAG: class I SAM-dependent methyltransferase [Nanoarchaeota archaeon]|nr:class I SAM-dependent methyltransferase [Nanoarchaeota archaeon]